MKKISSTPFGNMLVNFRFHRDQIIDRAKRNLWDRNKLSNPTARTNYKIVQTEARSADGTVTYALELWHLVDVERVRISTSVTAEILKDESKKDEDDWS